MIKRPLNARFSQAVLAGRKITTIRDAAWPCDVPIMLYHWSGAAYRSKHIDVAPIIVQSVRPITIEHPPGGMLTYLYGPYISGRFLWDHEGFETRQEMDDWFRPLVKPGTTDTKILMIFSLAHSRENPKKNENSKIRNGYPTPTIDKRRIRRGSQTGHRLVASQSITCFEC